ncbi:hypothetical protein LSH36_1148g00006 [Paralvinella palmiformis]|uniref:Uncharacterized protein n=1 Tax=Paralvinella palmiformis TaxID=53620 RepID=A0AAD9MPG6_9ANNE|nr:hypothetical protein LSH36_1148g00006 [Paralvinella palmiformis]
MFVTIYRFRARHIQDKWPKAHSLRKWSASRGNVIRFEP